MLETIAGFLDQAAALAPVWGYVFIFVFMAVESSFIPFPSEVVMVPAGFLAARGELTLGLPAADCALCVAAGVLGSIAGALFNYLISLKVGLPFLRRWGRWFFVKESALDRACEVFNRYGAAATFVCRLLPVIRQLISIPAGIARMPMAPFLGWTALGAGLWTFVLAAAGFAAGRSAADLSWPEILSRAKAAADSHLPLVIAAAAAVLALYWAAKRLAMGGRPR